LKKIISNFLHRLFTVSNLKLVIRSFKLTEFIEGIMFCALHFTNSGIELTVTYKKRTNLQFVQKILTQ